MAADDDTRLRWQADEGVAAEPLPALHRLQEIGVRLRCELEVDRKRRVEIGEGLQHQGNPVETFGGEPLEFDFGHEPLRVASFGNFGGVAREPRAEMRLDRAAPAAPATPKPPVLEARAAHSCAESAVGRSSAQAI